MIEKILIIGGSGFIGSNLLNFLSKQKFILFSASKKIPKKKNRNSRVNYISCDITNKKNLKKNLNYNFHHIINLSGNINHKEKKNTMYSHYIGCKNLVDFFKSKKIKTFLQISSSLEYGKIKSPQKEENKCKPIGYYGIAKWKATQYITKTAKFFKFPYVILRLYQIYGSKQKQDRLVPHIISSCLKGKKFNCTTGDQVRDFMHVDDLNKLIIKVLKKNIRQEIYNVGSGRPVKVKFIIKLIKKMIKSGNPIFGALKMRYDESQVLYPSIKKIKKSFSWQPKIDLYKGLKKTILSYKTNS